MHRPDAILKRHPLLVRLQDEQVERLAEAGEIEAFEPGETIVTEGSIGDSLYLLLAGQVDVLKDGHKLATLSAGEFFGEMSLVEPAARSASAVACDEARLFRIPHRAFQNLAEEDPQALNALLVAIVRVTSERLRRSNAILTSVGQLADWLAGSLV